MELSKNNKMLLLAVKKGYYVDKEGKVFNKNNELLNYGKQNNNNRNLRRLSYYRFGVAVPNSREKYSILVHRLVAYQKYGDKLFCKNIQVRHLDGNSLNNEYSNIEIGTASDNMMDKDPGDRLNQSIKAASKLRKFTDKEIEIIRIDHDKGKTYKQLMKKYNISSKGTMSYIINHKYLSRI